MRIIRQSDAIPAPRFLYSPFVQIGNLCQVSGMVALDRDSGQLVTGGPGAETTKIFANLIAALPDYGVTLDELLIARIYTTRMDAFAEINAAWDDVFTLQTSPPARTSIGVAALPLGATVEIEFSFVKTDTTHTQRT